VLSDENYDNNLQQRSVLIVQPTLRVLRVCGRSCC